MEQLIKEKEIVDYFHEENSILEKIDSCSKCGFSVWFGIDTTSIESNRLIESLNKCYDREERMELIDEIKIYAESFRTILIWTVEREDDIAFCICPNCKFENIYSGAEKIYEVEDITIENIVYKNILELLPENIALEWGEDITTTEGQGENK
jgi:hypothetical protein